MDSEEKTSVDEILEALEDMGTLGAAPQGGRQFIWVDSIPVELCKALLDTAPGVNVRKLKPTHVAHLASQMLDGTYVGETTQHLILSPEGLRDGQHRCAAAVKAAKPLTSVLIEYTENPSAWLGVDETAPRTAVDKARTLELPPLLTLKGKVDTSARNAWERSCLIAHRGKYDTRKATTAELGMALQADRALEVQGHWHNTYRRAQGFRAGGVGFWGGALETLIRAQAQGWAQEWSDFLVGYVQQVTDTPRAPFDGSGSGVNVIKARLEAVRELYEKWSQEETQHQPEEPAVPVGTMVSVLEIPEAAAAEEMAAE